MNRILALICMTLPLAAAEPPAPFKHQTVTYYAITVPVCDLCNKSVTYQVHQEGKIYRFCADHWIFGNDKLKKPEKKQ